MTSSDCLTMSPPTLTEYLGMPEENQRELAVVESKTCRSASDLAALAGVGGISSQLSFIISSPSCCFGNPRDIKSLEDCFDRRNVDDGLVFYKMLRSSAQPDTGVSFYYWLGYFGGNPTGYLLKGRGDGQWEVIIENCDTDFIWRGPGDKPKHFIKAVKKAVYGDKYYEDDDEKN
mmetsp:Transcript_14421/g.31260  ORF Transcript_14421/g.31260 Transcript_14421/m.31260 type:complete len:175 (+) Transcript_14421:90-614(+)